MKLPPNGERDPLAPRGLGDRIAEALSQVGVTEQGISQWLGYPCGCNERKEKLNQLSLWASYTTRSTGEGARDFLRRITGV